MNKREISEIKRQFSPSQCSITRICGCYVDGEKNIKAEMREAFLSLPEEDMFKYFEILRKGLSGKLGRNLVNLEFPLKAEEEDGAQEFLLRLRNSQLKDDDLLNDFYGMVIDSYDYVGNYLILLIHDAYDIPGKTSDGFSMDDASDEVYSYIMCCICPVDLSKPGLGYNEQSNAFQNRRRDWVVGMPDMAFLFPAFNDRSTDIHAALMYVKKNFQSGFVQSVLGCGIPLEAEHQKSAFNELVESVLGIKCTCEAVKTIYASLRELLEESKDSPDPLVLNKQSMRTLFESSGIDEEDMEAFDALYDNLTGGNNLLAANLMNEKEFRIELPDAVVKLNVESSNEVEIMDIKGRKCLVIGISGAFEVNGVICER